MRSLGERPALGLVAGDLGIEEPERLPHGERRIRTDLLGEFERAGQRLARLAQRVDEPETLGSLGRKVRAGEKQLAGDVRRQVSSDAECATEIRYEATLDL